MLMVESHSNFVHLDEHFHSPIGNPTAKAIPQGINAAVGGDSEAGFFNGRYFLKIQVESIGLPTLSKLIGKKSQLEMTDGTVADLVSHIVDRNGQAAHKILLDRSGRLDMAIQVMVNDEGFLPRGEYSRRILKDGDSVKFMLLVGGG